MFNPFQLMKNLASRRRLKRLNSKSIIRTRDTSFVRGAYHKFYGHDKLLYQIYMNKCEKIFRQIENSNLPAGAKEIYLTWEKFQSIQKGPVAPVTYKDYIEQILEGFQIEPINISEDNLKILEESRTDFVHHIRDCGINFDATRINFRDAWKMMSPQTVRGYDKHAKGEAVDEEIMKVGGTTLESAVEYFESTPAAILDIGTRYTGKPYGKPAGIRLYTIPPVSMQYIEQGILKAVQESFKNVPAFAGWLSPSERDRKITNMERESRVEGYTMIQIDYSKFDKHWHIFFQDAVLKVFLDIETSKSALLMRWFRKNHDLVQTQGVFLPNEKGKVTFYSLPYQWTSGRIFTQIGGSFTNVILAGYVYKKLNWGTIPYRFVLVNGDDCGFPVPTHVLKEHGYKKILELIAKVLSEVKFTLNPDKAYPTPTLGFLQTIYSYENGIFGARSVTRNLASSIWKPDPNRPIPGITRMWAMDAIIHISIMSEPFSRSINNIYFVEEDLADEYVKIDHMLMKAIATFQHFNPSNDGHEFYKFLIKLAGATVDDILYYAGRDVYDHSGLRDKLESKNYLETFPYIAYLLRRVYNFSDSYLHEIQKLDSGIIQAADELFVSEGIVNSD